MNPLELLQAVKKHALENYENDWDTLIECHDDTEILEAIGDAKTVEEAIANVDENLGITIYADRRRDIEGEIF